MTYQEVLKQGTGVLRQASIEEASVDAWYLFEDCFQMERSQYFLIKEEEAPDETCKAYALNIEKRSHHVPLQYIIGETEFMGLPFVVNKSVLIPRQDTECLVEEVLPFVKGKSVLDMCTGSGCIAISLSVLGDASEVMGVDFSKEALKVAEQNGERNHCHVQWVYSDLFCQIEEKYDVIVSNPPYILTQVVSGLMPEVREYEPMMALDGEEDGLAFYRRIVREAPDYLVAGGKIYFEIGCEQAADVCQMLEERGFVQVVKKQDLALLDRVVMGIWPKMEEEHV